jgi:hypothetical protein
MACGALALTGALSLSGTRLALATACDVIPGISPPNTSFGVLATTDDSNDRRWTVSQPYWIAVGAIANDPTDDFDINVFNNTQNANLPCYTGPLGTSSRGAGQTDFVVGDFNHNPNNTYVNTVTCYSGNCDGQVRGHQVWRDGDFFSVDGPPQILTLPSLADRVVKIWDIYLVQGTTYHFRFQPTGDNQPMLLLFRNPSGGVFWTGRYGAEFETANCVTNYTAPSTGYYGMVVVSDRYSVNPVSIILAVTTAPACPCPTLLADGVPVAISPGSTEATYGMATDFGLLLAAGVRSPSDWDLLEGKGSGVDVGCVDIQGVYSGLVPPKADVVVGDFVSGTFPDTFGVKALRYSGSDGATLELSVSPGVIESNALRMFGYMTADQVVRSWNLYMQQGITYSIRFFPGTADIKLLLYGNPSQLPSFWQTRVDAMLETTASTTFTAPYTGYYGLVLVKDDAPIGDYDLAYGYCTTPRALTTKVPVQDFDPVYPGEFKPYFSFNQQGAHWAAASVCGLYADWDIAQYGQASGNSWPECLGAAGALSNGVQGVDVIAGDFHYNPTGTYFLHSYPTDVDDQWGYTEWDAGSGALQVNPLQPVQVNMTGSIGADRLWCYEAYLFGGFPYTLVFTNSGLSDARVLLFENPGTAPYFAPRSSAILSTNTNATFTPAKTGWHGVVVVNQDDNSGTFTLSLLSSVVAVGGEPAPERDELSAVAPNPAHGPLRIDYALARPSQVSFEVLDLAGRVVRRIPASATGAGRWSQAWDGRGGSGQELAGGVYMLRMRVDGRTVATRKIMRIN